MRQVTAIATSMLLLGLVSGCAMNTPAAPAAMGDLGPAKFSSHRMVTLGAGDSLGFAIHSNDVVLAAAASIETNDVITDAQSLDQASEIVP
jgi:hypothetical protein